MTTQAHTPREKARTFDWTELLVAVLLDCTPIRQSCIAVKDRKAKGAGLHGVQA